MSGNINFWDSNVWLFMTELVLLFGSMLLANMLRRLIKPLRQSMIPSANCRFFAVGYKRDLHLRNRRIAFPEAYVGDADISWAWSWVCCVGVEDK